MPVEQVAGVVRDLIAEGKVLHFGLRTTSEALLRRAHVVQPVTALQADYSLWQRGLEGRILPVLFDLSVGLVPGQGAGAAATRGWGEYDEAGTSASSARIEAVLADIATAHAVTPSQVALAWLLGVSASFVPLTGSGYHDDIDASFAALSLSLSAQETRALDDIAAPPAAAQTRDGHNRVLLNS